MDNDILMIPSYPPQNIEYLRVIKKPQQLLLAGSCQAVIQKPDRHYLEQMLFQLCNFQPKTMAVSESKAVGQRKAKLYENHVKIFSISHILSFTAHASEMVCECYHAAAGLTFMSMAWICQQLRLTGSTRSLSCWSSGTACATGEAPVLPQAGDGPHLRLCCYLQSLPALGKGTAWHCGPSRGMLVQAAASAWVKSSVLCVSPEQSPMCDRSELLTCTVCQHQELTAPILRSSQGCMGQGTTQGLQSRMELSVIMARQANPGLLSWMKALLGSCRSLPLLGKLSLTELKKQAGLRK